MPFDPEGNHNFWEWPWWLRWWSSWRFDLRKESQMEEVVDQKETICHPCGLDSWLQTWDTSGLKKHLRCCAMQLFVSNLCNWMFTPWSTFSESFGICQTSLFVWRLVFLLKGTYSIYQPCLTEPVFWKRSSIWSHWRMIVYALHVQLPTGWKSISTGWNMNKFDSHEPSSAMVSYIKD